MLSKWESVWYSQRVDWGNGKEVSDVIICIAIIAACSIAALCLLSEIPKHFSTESIEAGYYLHPTDGTKIFFSHLEVYTGDIGLGATYQILASVAIGTAAGVGLVALPLLLFASDVRAYQFFHALLAMPLLLGIMGPAMGTTDCFEQASQPTIFTMDGTAIGWSVQNEGSILGLQNNIGTFFGYGALGVSLSSLTVIIVRGIALSIFAVCKKSYNESYALAYPTRKRRC